MHSQYTPIKTAQMQKNLYLIYLFMILFVKNLQVLNLKWLLQTTFADFRFPWVENFFL